MWRSDPAQSGPAWESGKHSSSDPRTLLGAGLPHRTGPIRPAQQNQQNSELSSPSDLGCKQSRSAGESWTSPTNRTSRTLRGLQPDTWPGERPLAVGMTCSDAARSGNSLKTETELDQNRSGNGSGALLAVGRKTKNVFRSTCERRAENFLG